MNKIVAVVVTYNRKELLEENIKALLNQSYENLDILIIDNASTDGTEEVVKKYVSDKSHSPFLGNIIQCFLKNVYTFFEICDKMTKVLFL